MNHLVSGKQTQGGGVVVRGQRLGRGQLGSGRGLRPRTGALFVRQGESGGGSHAAGHGVELVGDRGDTRSPQGLSGVVAHSSAGACFAGQRLQRQGDVLARSCIDEHPATRECVKPTALGVGHERVAQGPHHGRIEQRGRRLAGVEQGRHGRVRGASGGRAAGLLDRLTREAVQKLGCTRLPQRHWVLGDRGDPDADGAQMVGQALVVVVTAERGGCLSRDACADGVGYLREVLRCFQGGWVHPSYPPRCHLSGERCPGGQGVVQYGQRQAERAHLPALNALRQGFPVRASPLPEPLDGELALRQHQRKPFRLRCRLRAALTRGRRRLGQQRPLPESVVGAGRGGRVGNVQSRIVRQEPLQRRLRRWDVEGTAATPHAGVRHRRTPIHLLVQSGELGQGLLRRHALARLGGQCRGDECAGLRIAAVAAQHELLDVVFAAQRQHRRRQRDLDPLPRLGQAPYAVVTALYPGDVGLTSLGFYGIGQGGRGKQVEHPRTWGRARESVLPAFGQKLLDISRRQHMFFPLFPSGGIDDGLGVVVEHHLPGLEVDGGDQLAVVGPGQRGVPLPTRPLLHHGPVFQGLVGDELPAQTLG